MVQAHRHVSPELFLDRHRSLGRELEDASVQVRSKGHSVIRDPVPVGKAEDLKSTGIGEDRPVPAHERVQAAECGHFVLARPQGEMVRVRQQHASAGRRRICSGVRPLTVAWVPTGMNAGVGTDPCGVSSIPDRAPSRNPGPGS